MSAIPSTSGQQLLFYEKLEDFFRQWPAARENDSIIIKTSEGYELSIALPGMKREQIEIGVMGDILSISADRESAIFRRSFMLEDDIDTGNIETKYEHDILKLILRYRKTL